MEKSAQKGSIAPIAVVLAVLVFAGFVFLKFKSSQPNNSDYTPSQSTESATPKTFKSSKLMKFSIVLPQGFSAEEKFGQVTITSNDTTILITSNGTNFEDLGDYLNFLDNKNKNEVIETEKISINSYEAQKRTIVSPNDNTKQTREYFILIDGRVYLMSTESNTKALDQIAKSFRYTPD